MLLLSGTVILSCSSDRTVSRQSDQVADNAETHDTLNEPVSQVTYSAAEKEMIHAGLIDIIELDSTISVDLRYSTDKNFTGVDIYGDITRCFLQREVAVKLVAANKELHRRHSYYTLLVFDGARPVSIQKMMWDSVKLNPAERSKYLSDPAKYSLHNYGAAVDLTIVDEQGRELDMGTPYDFFGELAHPGAEEDNYKNGKLSADQILNRELLRSVMLSAGFTGIQTEWWHFNSCSRARAAEIYPLVE